MPRWTDKDLQAFVARGQKAQAAVDEQLARFEPNSGRGLPKETIQEMRRLAAEEAKAGMAPMAAPLLKALQGAARKKKIKITTGMRKSRSKYGNVPTVIDGIRFASKLEAKRYGELKLLQKNGDVSFFLRQVPFDLPGGVKYVADFVVAYPTGLTGILALPAREGGIAIPRGMPQFYLEVEDAKGYATREFKLKAKQVRALYDLVVRLVR